MCDRFSAEDKARLWVDEPPDQPCRGNAIDARTRPSHPQTVEVLRGLPFVFANRLRGLRFIGVSQQVLKLDAQRVPEEVDILKLQEPATNPIQASARSSRRGERKKFLRLVEQFLVVTRSRFQEKPFQLLCRQVIEALRLNHGGLAFVCPNRRG